MQIKEAILKTAESRPNLLRSNYGIFYQTPCHAAHPLLSMIDPSFRYRKPPLVYKLLWVGQFAWLIDA